jgi:GAF domain-containing protein
MNLAVLTRRIASECAHVYFPDLSQPSQTLQFHDPARMRGCYAGTPLVLNGTLYGALEFVSDCPHVTPWSEDELSILSMISMFSAAHLGLFGEITMLKNSERALLEGLARVSKLN